MTDGDLKPLAWISGAGGLIGNCLVQTAPRFAPGWRLHGLKRSGLDLLDFTAVRRAFAEQRPQLVLHCAAMTKTPDCQQQPELARRTNIEATALLAELAANIPFVFFSTDLVFDGRTGSYDESSPTNPLSHYGETKVGCRKNRARQSSPSRGADFAQLRRVSNWRPRAQ